MSAGLPPAQTAASWRSIRYRDCLLLAESDRSALQRSSPTSSSEQAGLAPDLPQVADIRQQGLMVGIELMEDPARKIPFPPEQMIGHRVITRARDKGVVIRPLGDVIILMPPLSISAEELDFLLDAVRDAVREVFESPRMQ